MINDPSNSNGEFKHTITNHKLTNHVRIKESKKTSKKTGRWVPIDQVRHEITTSFDKKAFQAISQFI